MARNRPQVFLSHSTNDKAFIDRVSNDLRRCQIEPWLAAEQIRYGESWLDAIFAGGIPACDVVLVYLTVSSIISDMVKKEIDAGLIRKLRDRHVAFHCYISDGKLRSQLRADLLALQIPEWNEENYSDMLPRVVAETWHSYHDRIVQTVANDEKVLRLEAELEIEKLRGLRGQDVFDERERADFAFIWSQLDRYEVLTWSHMRKVEQEEEEIGRYAFRFHLQSLIPKLDQIVDRDYDEFMLVWYLHNLVKHELPDEATGERCGSASRLNIAGELKMYGLLRTEYRQESDSLSFSGPPRLRNIAADCFADKMYRFKYWLAHERKLPEAVKWESVEVGNKAEERPVDAAPT